MRDSDGVKSLITFVGFGRDGHTLVAAVLASHPQIAISNQYRTFVYDKGLEYYINQFLKDASGGGNNWDYKYNQRLEGQRVWTDLKAIGHSTLAAWHFCPDELQMRAICMLRNPYDNIGRHFRNISLKRRRREARGEKLDKVDLLQYWINTYTRWAGKADKNKRHGPFDLSLEALITSPATQLRELTDFIGVDWDKGWAKRAARLIFPKPQKAAHYAPWTEEKVSAVRRIIETYPWLHRYLRENRDYVEEFNEGV